MLKLCSKYVQIMRKIYSNYAQIKTDIFSDVIYLIINRCEPRRPKDASGEHKVPDSRSPQASEARLYVFKHPCVSKHIFFLTLILCYAHFLTPTSPHKYLLHTALV